MSRLSRSNPDAPGLTRRRHGRGFAYYDPTGTRVTDASVVDRVRSLTVPPAWRDVWIAPDPTGHIQAVGVDAAGRRQYLYHQRWREVRDAEKFDRVLRLAGALPRLRSTVSAHLSGTGLSRERVLAAAARLLDLGTFRIGGAEYLVENGTFGLATLRRDHVRVRSGRARFDYLAKGGVRRIEVVTDPAVGRVLLSLRRRNHADPALFAYRADRGWHPVRAEHVNGYLRDACRHPVTAKDFRTWHGTVLMALLLAGDRPPAGATGRNREVSRCYARVADALGNTPAVARASYVDPRVVDRYHEGEILVPRGRSASAVREAVDAAGYGWDALAERMTNRTGRDALVARPVERAVITLLGGA